jgi:flagellar hook-associated protein 3 FlgL
MLSGIDSSNGSFLADLNQIENRISRTNQQITSGVRVHEASDDPSAIASILESQNQIDQVTQVQTNLNLAKNDASTADGALQSASQLLDQLISIATEGATSTQTASGRTTLGQQVQQIEQQLVGIANTTVGGRYIFGGDDPTTQPYTFNWASGEGVVQNNTASNTATIVDAAGNSIVPGMTAQQIFDLQNTNGTPATGNVFQAVYSLGQALLANDQTGVANAVAGIQAAATQVEQATAYYGNTENWIQQASEDAANRLTNLQQQLSSVRDTDIAAAATQLSTDQTALEAALSAHASLNNKSLFSYLG